MTADQIAALVQWCIIALGAFSTATISIAKYLKYLENKDRENSLGKAKVKEFTTDIDELKRQYQSVKEQNGRQQEDIDTLSGDYRTLLMQVMNFMGNKH